MLLFVLHAPRESTCYVDVTYMYEYGSYQVYTGSYFQLMWILVYFTVNMLVSLGN